MVLTIDKLISSVAENKLDPLVAAANKDPDYDSNLIVILNLPSRFSFKSAS